MCKKQDISHRNGQVLNSVGNLNDLKFRCQSGMEENHWYNKPAEWITSLQCLYLAHSGWYVPNWTIRVHQRIWLQKGQDQTVWIVASPSALIIHAQLFWTRVLHLAFALPIGLFWLIVHVFGCCNVPKIQVNWARFPVQSTPTGKKSGQTSLVPPDCIDKLITLYIHIVYHPHLWIWGWGTHGPTFFGAFLVNTIPMKIIK